MTVGADTLYFTYDASGVPATVTLNGTVYYYAVNAQGDVIGIYTETGTDVCTYAYDAWGRPVYTSNNSSYTIDELNPLRYRGYVFDQDTGLYYLQSRYYNPEWGRFINADVFVSTGQGILGNNMFAYCGNNPVSRADDGGEWWNVVAGAVIGAAVNFIGAVITELAEERLCTDDTKEFDWGDVWLSTGIGAAEGALTALCPGAAVFISAGANMAETIIDGVDDGDSAGEIVLNTVVAGAFGMVGADDVTFIKGGIVNDAVSSIGNAFGKGIHPRVRKAAKATVAGAVAEIGNAFWGGIRDSVIYGGLEEFTSWYAENTFMGK